MLELYQIQGTIEQRTAAIEQAHTDWPCRKGCADCCRQLAFEPRLSQGEWLQAAAAIGELPPDIAAVVRHRIRESAGQSRPVICPLLDRDSGACLIYDARPLACRSYGFYADRHEVLGCHRIESISREVPDIIWGNHRALDASTQDLGEARELSAWLRD